MIPSTKLQSFIDKIDKLYSYSIQNYDHRFIKNIIEKQMLLNNINDFDIYTNKILKNETFLQTFLEGLIISVTDMFRDVEPFKVFRKDIIKELESYPQIKIWSCGCATGSEVLSLAIILKEAGLYDRSLIYGTDINQYALKKAKEARYSLKDAIKFTQNYYQSGGIEEFSKYYRVDSENDEIVFNPSLLENVCYGMHNIISDTVFNQFEMVFCRNVFIYFDQVQKDLSLSLFKDSLVNGGYLFLGKSENVESTENKNYFDIFSQENRIYRKKYLFKA